jgi:hypothetical protein
LSTSKEIDPNKTCIYHITHIDNLPGIISAGGLLSDARRRRGDFDCTNIGHMHIKDRRMNRQVPVAAKGVLGDYVPFNFCPRSVMLCAIYYKNVAEYTGDQLSIVHLISTVGDAIRCGQPWAFTDRHAELGYACYYEHLTELRQVHWKVMPLRYWSEEKETRQAEFLVHDKFPWACVRAIGVHNFAAAGLLTSLLSQVVHPPRILVKPDWYYS